MPAEQPPEAPPRMTRQEVQNLIDVLFWISRSSHMNGPAGTKAYFISNAHMTQAQLLIQKIKDQNA